MWKLENTLGLKLAFLVLLILLILERFSNTFFKNESKLRSIKVFQKGYFYVLLGAYLAVIFVSAISYFYSVHIRAFFSFIGVAILFLGIALRRSAIRSLEGYWSVFVEIKEGQRIVHDGIYKYLKHPYYVAVVMELLGFSLICNSYLGLLLAVVIQVPLLMVRIHYENRILRVYGKRLRFN